MSNYQSTGNYLTTAMLSNAGSNFVGLNSALTGNGVSATINSSGISLNVPAFLTTAQPVGAYLTTAMLSNAATISNIKLSAGTLSALRSDISFNNSNGVSFGLETNGIITATVATNYQSQGAYLTTARASNDAIGLNTALTANGVSVTANSSGLSLNFPAFLTTAMQSGASTQFVQANAAFAGTNASGTIASNGISISVAAPVGGGAALKGSGTYTQNTGTIEFANSNGITFGLSNNGTMTASHNGLTTAMASNRGSDFIGTNTALTANGVSMTANSSGLSLNFPAFLTTAALSNHSHNFATTTTNGALIVVATTNSAGATIAVPSFITTAMASNAATISNINVSAGTTSSNLSAINFVNSNGVSWSLDTASKVYATVATNYQSQGAYLTTAMQTGSQSQLWIMGNSSATIGGTNISGTVFSNGMSLSVAAPGAGGGIAASISGNSTSGGAGYSNITSGTMILAGGPNITLSQDGSRISISANNPGAAAENNWVNLLGANTAGNTTASGSTIGWSGQNLTLSGTNNSQIVISAPATSSLSGTGAVSISINGSTISIGVAAATLSNFHHPENVWTSLGVQGQGSLSIKHFYAPFYVTGSAMKMGVSLSAVTNTSATTASCNLSLWMGIYTLNGSTLSLASSGSANNGFAWSQSASTTANTSINSMRQLTVPININMTPGEYWVAAVISSATTYTSAVMTFYGGNLINNAASAAMFAPIGSGTTASSMVIPFQGIYTANTSVGPASMSKANINFSSASNVQRANFYHQILNNTY